MRIVILGAGPAGLYLAYLIRRRNPRADVRVIEQNPPDATFGFGVVFSERALEFLDADDPETHAAIRPHLIGWRDITIRFACNRSTAWRRWQAALAHVAAKLNGACIA